MKVLLISANTERINMPALPLGMALVEAAARAAGHETASLDLLASAEPEAAVRDAVRSLGPEVVGISIRNIDDQEMRSPTFLLAAARRVVTACRAATEASIVLGGAGYSIFPEAVLAYLGADAGVAGEGEFVFPAVLERLARRADLSGLPGVHLPGARPAAPMAFAKDLDAAVLPEDYPAASVAPDTPDLYVPVQSRRGCPLGCAYCSTATIEGRAIRMRSPGRVADHVARIADRGFGRFYFVDNTFNHPPAHAHELCRELEARGRKVSFRAILYPHRVDRALVEAMARAGCTEVSLGFESGSPPVLAELRKRFGPEEVREIAALLGEYGIRRMGFLLLGGPGETRETVRESLDFAASLGLEMLKVTVGIRIYPGTRLHRAAIGEGIVDAGDDLLFPRFYAVPGLEEFIRAEVERRSLAPR